ncbi:MAG: hypothetical protein ACFFDW_00880, partial [Candidatus Thorarchaeota archaeon]
MIDQIHPSNSTNTVNPINYHVYNNKKSSLNESILIQHNNTDGTFSFHVYAIIVTESKNTKLARIIDLRKSPFQSEKSTLKIVGNQKKGSLSLIRYFFKNPAEKEYLDKLKEKYPDKSDLKSKKYFPPVLLLLAHYCQYFQNTTDTSDNADINHIEESLIIFEEYVREILHPTLKALGKPLYLKGKDSLVNYHLTREIPQVVIDKLLSGKILQSINLQNNYTRLILQNEGIRKDPNEIKPFLEKHATPDAITRILNNTDKFLPIHKSRFPLVVVGEPEIRRNIMLNIIKNSNARFLILDPLEEYGKLAKVNPQIQGFLLGENFLLNIISTEGDSIREQVYSYWFAKIIAYIANLRADIEKTLETYLLGAYNDPNNQSKTELQFRKFANQEITSEVTKMNRNESSIVSNTLYPLGTYQEISIITRIGRSQSLETLFETKGSIIQFAKDDDQLTKISYLFTVLKLRSVQNDEPKILILDNLDEIIGKDNRQNIDLSNLILGLADKYYLVIGIKSPSKVIELFKQTKTKLINRLTIADDQKLLEKEFNINNYDIMNFNKMNEKEFYVLVPELAEGSTIKVDAFPNTRMRIEISEYEKESAKRILQSDNYLRKDGIPPEVRKALFEIIKILREKPRKMIPVEGFEQLINNCSEVDILRAKEIAKADSLIKIIESSPDDSNEIINLIKLTEIGDEFYRSYLSLQEKMPKLSLKTLATEKDFENNIFGKLEKIKKLIKEEDNKIAIDEMVDITIKLLAVLPEEERFMSGKIAAQILDHWAFLSSLKETQNEHRVINFFVEFSQLVTNALKSIKHQVLERKELANGIDNSQPKEQKIKRNSTEKKIKKEEYEFDFDFLEKMDDPSESKANIEKMISDDQEKNGSKSTFMAATDDLRTAGLPHKDSNGKIFHPKKQSKTRINDQNIEKYDPFEADKEDKSVIDIYFEQQRNIVDDLKEQLMDQVANNLDVSEITDPDFIWHCLASRFSGKLDDGFTISEVVVLIKKLMQDVQEEALISEEIVKRIEKLIHSTTLMD